MRRRPARYAIAVVLAFVVVVHSGSTDFQNSLAAENLTPSRGAAPAPSANASRTPAGRDAGPAEGKQDRLLEREVALSFKEQEMKRLGETLEARIRQLDDARKAMEESLSRKKQEDSEKYAKMLKVYKALRPEAAAALIDRLDEGTAFEMLNRMDQKTAVKLIPFLNQARVVKWTKQNLKGS